MEVTLSGHGAYQLVYHVVWVIKYRRKILNPGMVECLQSLMLKLARNMSGVIVEQMGFDRDHVHFPPKYAVADIMGELKSRSASMLRVKFDFLKKVYWRLPRYFVSSIGIDEAIIKHYVEWQGRQDSGQLHMEL